MSLINDALKRAKLIPKRSPANTVGVTLNPADTPGPLINLSRLAVPILVVVLAAGGWFVWKWWSGGPTDPTAAGPVSTNKTTNASQSTAAGANKAGSAKSPALVKALDSAKETVAAVQERNADPGSAGTTAPSIAPAEAAPAPVAATGTAADATAATASEPAREFPPLKLQGIFYRLKNPSALINGQTVLVGQQVEGVQIASIDRNTVVVQLDGQSRELKLK
jgi:hypothetical protein